MKSLWKNWKIWKKLKNLKKCENFEKKLKNLKKIEKIENSEIFQKKLKILLKTQVFSHLFDVGLPSIFCISVSNWCFFAISSCGTKYMAKNKNWGKEKKLENSQGVPLNFF